jgi:hypothetical protein
MLAATPLLPISERPLAATLLLPISSSSSSGRDNNAASEDSVVAVVLSELPSYSSYPIVLPVPEVISWLSLFDY